MSAIILKTTISRVKHRRCLHKIREVARHSERGDTLLEILIALTVIGITAVALLTAFATAITSSSQHRNLANNNSVLWGAAETAFSQIQLYANTNFDTTCSSTPYSGFSFGVDPAKYSVTLGPVLWWNSSTQKFSTSCTSPSYVPQEMKVTVTNKNGTSDSAYIVVGHFP